MKFQEFAEIICNATDLNVDDVISTGGCHIRFQDSFDVHIDWDERNKAFYLYAPLIQVPTAEHAELYALLLRPHLFSALAQGAVIGIHHHRKEIMLFKKVRATEITEMECLHTLQQFVQQTAFWIQQLNNHSLTA